MSNKTLTLAIVIPVYNEQSYLKACLDSIATQAVLPDEVIVVDNNSTDRTLEIARSYKFVKVINETKQGVVFARNRGFDAAKSQLIGRIDGDTILPANWVADVKRLYTASGSPAHFAATAPSSFRNHYKFFWYGMHRVTYFWPSRLMLGHTTFVCSNMLISRKLWQEVRQSVCLRTNLHEDMDLALHVARTGTKSAFIPASRPLLSPER